MPLMILDVHTHVFPPAMIARRADLVAREPGFAAMYATPSARMVTAGDLVESMDRAGVDRAVCTGFWWSDPALCEEHADYLLAVAGDAAGRLVPVVPVAPGADLTALAARGAAGVGEVRPATQPGLDLLALGHAAAAACLPLLVHVSEEIGHAYPGKEGGLSGGDLWRLIAETEARVIAAHWGGGLAFAALMPEVRAAIEGGRLIFDTAASAYLYDATAFPLGVMLAGTRAVAWGSDYPLRAQDADRAFAEQALARHESFDPAQGDAGMGVMGHNAARFLGLL